MAVCAVLNGKCRVDLASLFPECTLLESNKTPWHINLTPKRPFIVYKAKIGDTYLIVKSYEAGINGKFTWSISAVRRGYAGTRFRKYE